MKKLLILSVFAIAGFSACKKKETAVSSLYTYSTPTITVIGAQYYSIPVGGALPAINASAYDSFYHEAYPVLIDQSTLDNTTPGLYAVTATSRNKYGMQGTKSVYIAVTDVAESLDISGTYVRNAAPGRVAHVSKLATGLFMTDNVGGVDVTDPSTGASIAAVFAVTSPTEIDFGHQVASSGAALSATDATLDLTPPVTFSYILKLDGFSATAVRTFVKQ